MNKPNPLSVSALASSPARDLAQVLRFLSFSPTGRSLVQQLAHQQMRGRIRVRKLDDMSPVSATFSDGISAFAYDGQRITLYLDYQQSLGVLTLALVHEIAQALDREFLDSFDTAEELQMKHHHKSLRIVNRVCRRTGKPMSELEDDDFTSPEITRVLRYRSDTERFDHQRIFRSKRRAFDLQYQVFKELSLIFADLEGHLEQLKIFDYLLDGRVTDQDILYLCGLNPEHFSLLAS